MSTAASYFDDMYRGSDDPWKLASRWYEQRKYDLTLAALPRARYRSGFEPACSVGELTTLLADRCDALLACDRVASAVGTAQRRTAHLPQVTVRQLVLPRQWPAGTFDLVVLSELLYYFDPSDLSQLLDRTVGALEPAGTLVTVHWNHPVREHLWTGVELADVLARVPELALMADHREDDFVLQVFGRLQSDGARPPSPATREGLV
ncbi:methyltransferase domain-containing protein [Streptomyces sp. SID13666]|uniref:SAM-dependent methyltransferase n=1 Tax=Streptomyces TaxID=1883 RepID=UPI001105F406|nr:MULTISPECIES: SAM-dependent methyltransferase [unclassified Streptomyces]MCZ4098513.1 SAM-dependent methyltransferase [Streptomyces sp. H39-C1]NEA56466.1 methyltransferase domain-containing protein [Streptomyces sp. SID13666]NEA75878.1 methyltransferase domain-containing protein [Streptomyces sp. SID13588]QNA77421.1 methyltransferase domain-containing protein [Streptomyces sp. So13.3]